METGSAEKRARIGLLGGAFNPVHKGHLALAAAALSQYDLNEVWLMPTGISPHKETGAGAGRQARLQMAALAAAETDPRLRVCAWELLSDDSSYTWRTLSHLTKACPDTDFFFILGEDSLRSFCQWKHPKRISRMCTILAAPRGGLEDGEPLEVLLEACRRDYDGVFEALTMPADAVSSTDLRRKLAKRRPCRDALPQSVVSYIREHRLYQELPAVWDFDAMEADLEKKLKRGRYLHSLGVMDTCCALAARWDYPVEAARCAGLLHDCARYMSPSELLVFARKKKLPVSKVEEASPALLHARVGAWLAEKTYGVSDPEVLSAIRVHTTGAPKMGLLSRILFAADYIEPRRSRQPRLGEIRQTAFSDLDLCCSMILEDTVSYLKDGTAKVDPATEETRRYFERLIKRRADSTLPFVQLP